MAFPDPVELANIQLQRDKRRLADLPWFLELKINKMRASPLAFLRGSAPFFYEVLSRKPEWASGPDGEGWLVGDLHLENFGAFRAEPVNPPAQSKEVRGEKRESEDLVVFDVNDFDEAFVGPWRLDLLRLLTSLLLAGREFSVGGHRALELCDLLLETHSAHCAAKQTMPPPPQVVARMLDKVRRQTRQELLAARTEGTGNDRRFVRGNRYRELPKEFISPAKKAFERYSERIQEHARGERSFEILDLAWRVAGTGSLGTLRIAVLTAGKGGDDGAWIFDMKEQLEPSAKLFMETPELKPARRVATCMRASLTAIPRMVETTRVDGRSMIVRWLAPQEDKLSLSALRPDELAPLASYLGRLTGELHRRSATKPIHREWKAKDRRQLLDAAIRLAGLHEAAYLAFCELSRSK